MFFCKTRQFNNLLINIIPYIDVSCHTIARGEATPRRGTPRPGRAARQWGIAPVRTGAGAPDATRAGPPPAR
jgi:hypothetical protein